MRRIFFLFIVLFGFMQLSLAGDVRHTEATLRLIGHEILLASGDSSSRILPIKNMGSRFKLAFASDFGFDPDELVRTIDSIVRDKALSRHYLVEVVSCLSGETVYSYERGDSLEANIVPCKDRLQPVGCYFIWIDFLDEEETEVTAIGRTERSGGLPWWTAILVLIPVAIVIWRIRKNKIAASVDTIQLGDYQFDRHRMRLFFKGKVIALSGKEAELLLLLHRSVNSTLEREEILRQIWGDQGDYIGRTLDVFISKLRKKLQEDARIQIINIRGVGYKMVVEV